MKSTRIICICLSAILALLCAFTAVACSGQNTDPVSKPVESQPGQTSSDASDVSKPDTESSSEPGPAPSADEPSQPDEPKEKPKPIDMEAVLTELVEENQGADPETLCDLLLHIQVVVAHRNAFEGVPVDNLLLFHGKVIYKLSFSILQVLVQGWPHDSGF